MTRISVSVHLALQRLDNGRGFGRVDRGSGLGFGVVNQVTEIVGKAGEEANFGSHDISMIQISIFRQSGIRFAAEMLYLTNRTYSGRKTGIGIRAGRNASTAI